MMKNALVILAGGKGKRFGQKIPKQFLKIGNTNFLNYFISFAFLVYFLITHTQYSATVAAAAAVAAAADAAAGNTPP